MQNKKIKMSLLYLGASYSTKEGQPFSEKEELWMFYSTFSGFIYHFWKLFSDWVWPKTWILVKIFILKAVNSSIWYFYCFKELHSKILFHYTSNTPHERLWILCIHPPQHLFTLSTSKCKIIKIKFQPREAEPSRSTPHLSRALLYSSTPAWISEASQSVASLEDGCSKHQSSVDTKQHASIWNLIETYEKLWSNSEKLKQWWHLLKSDML